MDPTKAALRTQLRARRRKLSPADCQAAAQRIAERLSVLPVYRAAHSLLAYLPHENEVPTRRLVEDAACRRQPIFLPKKIGSWQFVEWQPGAPLRQTQSGIFEPVADAPTTVPTPSIALVPLVGWDRSGVRLGRGAGIYDRLLSAPALRDAVTRVGLAYDFQEITSIPSDRWDVPLHYIITEGRSLEIHAAPPGLSGKEV